MAAGKKEDKSNVSPQIDFRVPPGLKDDADKVIAAEGWSPAAFHRHVWINGLKHYLVKNAKIQEGLKD